MQGRDSGFFLGALSGIFFSVTATASSAVSDQCLPFFDYSNDKVVSNVVRPGGSIQKGEVDITPEPIGSNAFGDAVLAVCGEFGSKVNPQAVRKLAENFSPDLMKHLAREFPGYTHAQLRALMAQIWTSTNGFEHVFCGQPKKGKVGGLHYANRYFELQVKGQLCRLDNNILNEEVLPKNVYTIGLSTAGGIIDRKKGFSIRQTAEDIFFEATRTYLRNCQAPSKDRRVCISRFYKDGAFVSLFVCSPNAGVITFYPLANVPNGAVVCR